MNIMKLLFFIVFLFCFVNLGVCLDNWYLNCSTQTFECGDLDNIRYPFSGMRRPYNCGLPDFLLHCSSGNSPEMFFNGEKYGVLKIDQQNKIMRIVNPDFLMDGTCPWSHIKTTALDFRLFHYSEKVVNITLFTGCNISSMPLLNHQDFTRFFCPGNSTDGNVDGFFIDTQSLIRIPRQNLPTCRYNVTVPVMKTFLDGISDSGLHNVLGAGFEISYADDAENNSTCKMCNISGGECGYDRKRDKAICFCPEGSPRYGTTQTCAEDSGRRHLDKKILIGDETNKYRNCSSEAFECEILNPVKYPFWGMSRPRYCGLPDLNLQCVDDTPLIFIKSQKYHILNIDQENKMMTIVNTEFLVHDGCPWPNAKTTTLDFRLFNYSKRVVNVTLFTGCSNSSILLSNNQSTRYALCPGNSTNDYFVQTQSLIENPHQNLPKCTNNITVPVMKLFLERKHRDHMNHIGGILSSGFEVSYDTGNASADISNCKICEKSGGECGYDTAFTCFCPNGRNTRTSSGNGKTQTCAEDSGRGELERNIIIGTSVAVSSILALVIVVLLISLRNKQIERKHDQQIVEAFYRNQGSLALKRYKYLDVKKMTSSFKEKIGQGGFGSVFKGKLHDGHPVAVKLLFTNSKNNGEEFINEVESISRTSHVNVVNLLGFCLEGKKRALIYEYMPNGSLEKFIYNDMPPLPSGDHHPQLGGDTLYQIAIGIARGLEYLHRGCNTRILHFDIKPHNILLDEEFCPKIADFGLAKLCTRKESKISYFGTRGTTGYIAPEVFIRNFGGVSYKSDVYSYGMLILEMVGGRKNFKVGVGMDHSSEFYYPHWIYDRLEQNDILGLHGIIWTKASEEIARKMIIVGLWCIQTNPTNRPSMTKVLEMLEGSSENLHIPPKPILCSPSRTSPTSSPSRKSPTSSPTTVLLSTKHSSSTLQQPSPSTLISMSIGR